MIRTGGCFFLEGVWGGETHVRRAAHTLDAKACGSCERRPPLSLSGQPHFFCVFVAQSPRLLASQCEGFNVRKRKSCFMANSIGNLLIL